MEDSAEERVVERMAAAVEEIAAAAGNYRSAYKKQLGNLSRRIKLLLPMIEELREPPEQLRADEIRSLVPLADALDSAKELLKLGTEGSKIYLVLEKDKIMARYQEVTAQLEDALDAICFDKLDISDEVREQVELVHAQFKRAKERVDMPDAELCSSLEYVYGRSSDASADPATLQRLSEKLQLTTISDLKQESLVLHEMVGASEGDPGESIEKMSMLLKKIKDFVLTQDPVMGTPTNSKCVPLEGKSPNPVIPDDFRCPISLELMKDPVIVATGQTYERSCIEKWLELGHDTCPKTQQKLPNISLTPNYVLRSLIAQWCEANGMEPPKRPLPCNSSSTCHSAEHANIDALIRKLALPSIDEQRLAAGELRLLAKRNNDNRVCIGRAGAVPLLVKLLYTSDPRTQEHAVTALLNLSICDENKGIIISSGAVAGTVHVLKVGTMESRENAAATLFSLSVVDENKVIIGASGAIPPLVALLNEGSQRGKKDAATALFNLCIYQGNKARAVRAGAVPTLMGLITTPAGAMIDEALALLAILASHAEGKAAIGAANAVPVLVEVIGSGSPRNRENAAAVMVHLCSGEQHYQHLAEAQECGVVDLLRELMVHGTERGKRKAGQLLERMNRFVEQQKQVEAMAQLQTQAELAEQEQAEEMRPASSLGFVDQ